MAILSFASIHYAAGSTGLNAELTQANSLLQAKEYERAFAEYSKRSQGNPLAQFNLGLIEQNGWGRPVDPNAACRWFEKASAGNIPMAQQMLADCYRLGINAPASFATAEKWYREALANGLPTASYWWGRMLIDGEPGDKNIRQGVKLCEQAAQAGAVEAQLYLARSYQSGEVLGKDKERALYWYDRAAQNNNPEALYRLGMLMKDDVPKRYSRAAVLHTLESAAAQGYRAAYLPTAELYFSAPVDSDTEMPTSTNLAKTYLWLCAALATSESTEEQVRAEKMMKAVKEVMPPGWISDLDQEVEDHFTGVNGSDLDP